MKHVYLVTLYGYREEGDLFFATGFAKCNVQAVTKPDLVEIMEIAKRDSDVPLNLHSVSYLGHMTEDAFEHLRSMQDE